MLFDRNRGALPEASAFQPFFASTPPEKLRVWPRTDEMLEFADVLSEADQTHIILTGPTGAGKSTLVRESFLKSEAASKYSLVPTFDDYLDFTVELIERFKCPPSFIPEQTELAGRMRQFLAEHHLKINQSLTDKNVAALSDPLARDVVSFIERALDARRQDGSPQMLFVFDQIERFLILMSRQDGGGKFNAYELVFLRKVLRAIRMDMDTRTVFVLREDFLYRSVELLLQGVSVRKSQLDVFRIFMCFGINSETSKDAIPHVQAAFRQLEFTSGLFNQFSKVSGLSTGMLSNTFMLQLTGYMIEHYYLKDQRVRDVLDGKAPLNQVVVIFFDYLINGMPKYRFESKAVPAEIVRVILFTIATENRNTGLHVDAARVAALAHVPLAYAKLVFEYLIKTGVVHARKERGVDNNGGGQTIRFAHDILSDFILKSEALTFNADLRVSIARLSEEHIPNEELRRIRSWPDVVRDWAAPGAGVVALWIFYAYCVVRLLHEPSCKWLDATISPLLPPFTFFASVGCDNAWWYYGMTFLMHSVWVTYIYHLDRSYFSVVLRGSWLRLFGFLLPILGVLCGLALGASPRALVIPTFVVGTVMALLLIAMSYTHAPRTQFAEMNRGWGLRTLINMVISVVMSVLLVLAMSGDEQVLLSMGLGSAWSAKAATWMGLSERDLLQGLWVNVAAIVMFYFWWHIRERQQSPVGAAFRVALFDRSIASKGVVSSGTLINS